MEMKAEPPVNLLEHGTANPFVEAYFEFAQLKQLYRQGWLRRGVPPERCESVAEHTFSMALLAMLIVDAYYPGLDSLKVLRMALLHDCGEIYAGDIVPADQVDAQEKHRRERAAVEQVLGKLPNGPTHIALWQEYEEGASAEARFVKQIDRLDMGLQATIYERQGLIDASEFMASVRAALTAPELQAILHELENLRQ
jgi:putative hydrolases of HD superfamily